MSPVAALTFSVLKVSGACLEIAALFGKCVFMLEGEFEESLWSQVMPGSDHHHLIKER